MKEFQGEADIQSNTWKTVANPHVRLSNSDHVPIKEKTHVMLPTEEGVSYREQVRPVSLTPPPSLGTQPLPNRIPQVYS